MIKINVIGGVMWIKPTEFYNIVQLEINDSIRYFVIISFASSPDGITEKWEINREEYLRLTDTYGLHGKE